MHSFTLTWWMCVGLIESHQTRIQATSTSGLPPGPSRALEPSTSVMERISSVPLVSLTRTSAPEAERPPAKELRNRFIKRNGATIAMPLPKGLLFELLE